MQSRKDSGRSAHAQRVGKTKHGHKLTAHERGLVPVAAGALLALLGCGGRHAAAPVHDHAHGRGAAVASPEGRHKEPCPMRKGHEAGGMPMSGEGEHCPMHGQADGGVAPEHPHGHRADPMTADGGMMHGHGHGGSAP